MISLKSQLSVEYLTKVFLNFVLFFEEASRFKVCKYLTFDVIWYTFGVIFLPLGIFFAN